MMDQESPRVEMGSMKYFKKRVLLPASVGLLVISAVLVTTYDGTVKVENEKGSTSVHANGQGLTASKTENPLPLSDKKAAVQRHKAGEGELDVTGARDSQKRSDSKSSARTSMASSAKSGKSDVEGVNESKERSIEPKKKEEKIQCSVQGTVLVDGKPKSDVKVSLFKMVMGGAFSPMAGGTVSSDAEGKFNFQVTGGKYGLYAQSINLAMKNGHTNLACLNNGDNIEATIILQRAKVHLTGSVLDRDGNPLANSIIQVRNMENPRWLDEMELIPVNEVGRFSAWLRERNNPLQVVAFAIGYTVVVKEIPTKQAKVHLEFILKETSVVKGIVVGLDRKPKSGARVSVSYVSDNGTSSQSSTTDKEGKFALEGGPGEIRASSLASRRLGIYRVASKRPRCRCR